MRHPALLLAPVIVIVLLLLDIRVDGPDATGTDRSAPSVEPAPRIAPEASFGPCTPGSQGTCAGQVFGTVCGTNPTRFCLPVPNAGNLCRCATQ